MGTSFTSHSSSENNIFLDFEGAPGDNNNKNAIEIQVAQLLEETEKVLERLKYFRGCDEVIKVAYSNPCNETEKDAWNAILGTVETIQVFYLFSIEIEKIFPKLLTSLFQANDVLKNNFQEQQSLVKQLAEIFDFALHFDDIKMSIPFLGGDFSYYRRALYRMNINNPIADFHNKEDLANKLSLFISYPTPMMKALVDSTFKFLNSEACPINKVQVIEGLSLMANVFLDLVEKSRFTNSKTNRICLHGMTGSIILMDHIDALGAFHRKSIINIKGAIKVLKNFNDFPIEGLLNALRYTTVHLNDPETPRTIKQLLK